MIALTSILTLGIATPGVHAYNRLICTTSGQVVKWPTTAIRYAAFGGSYGSTISSSRNAWNNAQSSATLTAVSPTTGNPHFLVRIANYGNALPPGYFRKPGTTAAFPGCTGGNFITGEFEALTNTYFGTGAFRLQNTTVHEMGHAFGLAHNNATFTCAQGPGLGYIAIMYSEMTSGIGSCAINTPRSDDVSGVNAIY